ncbi:MAG: CHAD domain-containing protein [Thermoflexales bacterium]|nr:CHAD domain-containing protein [Thermoflexales bacterium]
MTSKLEVEWQFEAPDLDVVEQWATEQTARHGVKVDPASRVIEHDSYFDTQDWRFFRAGCALRVRRAGDVSTATLKTFGQRRDGAHQRIEISEPVALPRRTSAAGLIKALTALPGPVGERIRLVCRDVALTALFSARAERRLSDVRLDGSTVAELALDTVAMTGGAKRSPLIVSRVELEARGEPLPILQTLADALRDDLGLSPAGESKYELGLKLAGLHPTLAPFCGSPASAAELAETERKPSIGALAYAVMRERFAQFSANEPGTRLGDDPEFVHDMRTATRRLRAAMGLFEPFLPHRAIALRDGLRWFATQLGAVRDIDVQLEHLTHGQDGIALVDGADAVIGLLRAQREQARLALLRAIDSPRYTQLLAAFEEMLRAGPRRADAIHRQAADAMPAMIEARYRKVNKAFGRLGPDSPPQDYHALRILIKRFRYALEFAEPLFGKPISDYLPVVVGAQETLGGYQDAEVALAHLRALSLSPEALSTPATLLALSEMSRQRILQGEALRARAPEEIGALTGKAWRRLKKGMR